MKKIFAIFLSVLSAFGAMCTLGGCAAPAKDKDEGFIDVEVDASLSDIENVVFAGDQISLPERMVFASTVLSEDKPYSVTLTATIEPIDATDQRVEWSVLWQDSESAFAENDVDDYVSIDVDGNYGKTATVTCLKAFNSEEIVVRATAYGTDISSECVCTFAGIPTSARLYDAYSYDLDCDVEPTVSNGFSYYDFRARDTIEWSFDLDNEYHYVSNEFYDDFEFELTENCSKVYISSQLYDSNDNLVSEEEQLVNVRDLNLVSLDFESRSFFMYLGPCVENYSETFEVTDGSLPIPYTLSVYTMIKKFSNCYESSFVYFELRGTNGKGLDIGPIYFTITDYGN